MNINSFMESFKENLLNLFNGNLLFLGLQGSYGRGEAKENSDRAAQAARESQASEKTDEETLQEITK